MSDTEKSSIASEKKNFFKLTKSNIIGGITFFIVATIVILLIIFDPKNVKGNNPALFYVGMSISGLFLSVLGGLSMAAFADSFL